MKNTIRADAEKIIAGSIAAVLPDTAVKKALKGIEFPGRVILVAIGKAAWQMARTASAELGERIDSGIVITKYDHVKGEIPGVVCRAAGHPVPDRNSFSATKEALALTAGLSETDTVLFLISGGGSALFESPLCSEAALSDITGQLLACGADIVEINTIRKRLSSVKGGRFAEHCAPARMMTIILSDIVGDPVDMIASGPACPDSSTCADAIKIVKKYGLKMPEDTLVLLSRETPKALDNVEILITGSVRELCRAAAEECEVLGYRALILTDHLQCEAKDAGSFLGSIALTHSAVAVPTAYIAGGETVVHLRGKGKGCRNQELALAAAEQIAGLDNVVVFSLGSDGTDGPTDAAGGIVDGSTAEKLASQGLSIAGVLAENDAYNALATADGLIITGPTGTNVNDVAIVLIGK